MKMLRKRTIRRFVKTIIFLGIVCILFIPHEAHAQQTAYGIKHIINAQVEYGQGTISPSGQVEVEDGGSQTFTMTPDEGWEITDVKVDNVPQGPLGSYSFNNVTEDHTISVIFERAYTISIDGEGRGTISHAEYGIIYPPGGDFRAHLGETHSFDIEAAKDWEIDAVYKDGVEMGYKGKGETSATAYFGDLISGIVGNHTLKAVFAPLYCKLTILPAEEGGTTNPSPGEYTYKRGTSVTINAIARSSYRFKEWSGDILGRYKYANPLQLLMTCDETMSCDKTIQPNFIKTYTIDATASTGGKIEPPMAIVDEHGSKYFTITPDTRYSLNEILVDGVSVPFSSEYVYLLSDVIKNHHIHANFAIRTYTIETIVDREGGGTISPRGERYDENENRARLRVTHSSEPTFVVIPDYGYEIDNVKVNGAPVMLENNRDTFPPVTRDHQAIYAKFNPRTYPIVAEVIPKNKNPGSINGPSYGAFRSEVTFKVSPNTGYEIWRVTRDDYDETDDVLEDGAFSFMVEGNHAVGAEFRETRTVATGTALFSVANEGKGTIEADTGSGFEDVTNERKQLADYVTMVPLRIIPQDDFIDDFIIKEIKVNGETVELTEDEKIHGFQGDVDVAEGLRVEVSFTCLGDSDGDGKIDVRDIILTAKHAADHKTPEGSPLLQGDNLWAANVNSDFDENGQARINILDIILTVRRIVGAIDRFPDQLEFQP